MTQAILIEGLSRAFGGRGVLVDVAMQLESGQIATIYGANGSGKTTLLRIMAGILRPDTGSVVVAGAPPGGGQSFFVPAGDRMLNWRLTGRQNLEFYARMWGMRPPGLSAEVDRAASLIGPLKLLQAAAGDRSTGQRRRLMLAIAFLSPAPVLLLDEPFADLDAGGRRLVAAAMRGLADSGAVIVLATPHIEDSPIADRSFVLEDGVMRVMS